MGKLKVAWIKFKLLFIKKPYGISHKGVVYLNRSAKDAFKESD